MRARLDAAAARVRHPRAWLRGAWQGQSLRTKLVVMIAALMLALVAVTALATAALFRQEAVRQLDEDMAAVAGRGACHHPDGATRMIASAMTIFARDAEAHAHGRPCAGAGHVVLPVPAASRAWTGAAR